jgi:hypothetical protein
LRPLGAGVRAGARAGAKRNIFGSVTLRFLLEKNIFHFPLYLIRQTNTSFGHPVRCHQVEETQPQLQREAHRGDHVQVSGALRGPQEVPRGEGGALPVQKHVPECQRRQPRQCCSGQSFRPLQGYL